jgi:glycosyltransferase involved in cell wall biosynthesis
VSRARSIALVNPLGDYGLGSYTHELAEGLIACRVPTDVFAPGQVEIQSLARRHRLFPVLGSLLLRQRDRLDGRWHTPGPESAPSYARASATRESPSRNRHPLLGRAREAVVPKLVPIELAAYLRWKRYDVVWTQWPVMRRGGALLWTWSRRLGRTVVHTVHDVRPHEPIRGYFDLCRTIYACSELLVVHSRAAAVELLTLNPEVTGKVLVAPHGLYTVYPMRRESRGAVRQRLGVADDEALVLCFGGIRPYKNIEAVLDALAADGDGKMVIVIAGRESGYPDLVPGDPLGRVRRLVSERKLEHRVRLLPGPFDPTETAELFAATDVALLPYLHSSGSGLLLLCMTFGVHIAATPVGGMDEYLEGYPRATLLEGPLPAQIGAGLEAAIAAARRYPPVPVGRAPYLEWPAIAAYTLDALDRGPPDPLRTDGFGALLANDQAPPTRSA